MMCVCWMLGLGWVGVVWPLPSPRPHPRPLSRCCRVFWGRGGIVVGGGVGWCLGALEGLVVGVWGDWGEWLGWWLLGFSRLGGRHPLVFPLREGEVGRWPRSFLSASLRERGCCEHSSFLRPSDMPDRPKRGDRGGERTSPKPPAKPETEKSATEEKA